jgi:hypothetical protein
MLFWVELGLWGLRKCGLEGGTFGVKWRERCVLSRDAFFAFDFDRLKIRVRTLLELAIYTSKLQRL